MKVAEKKGEPQVSWSEGGTGWAKALVEGYEAPGWLAHTAFGSDSFSYFTRHGDRIPYSLEDIARLSWGEFLGLGFRTIRHRI